MNGVGVNFAKASALPVPPSSSGLCSDVREIARALGRASEANHLPISRFHDLSIQGADNFTRFPRLNASTDRPERRTDIASPADLL